MHITGGCHCGAIRYQAEIDPERVTICHCTDCQRLTGSAYRVTAPAQPQNFTLILGEPHSYAKHGDSGALSRQFFCPNCGSPLYRTDGEGGAIGIRVGGIDQRRDLTPKKQIWCRSALSWSENIEPLPRFDGED
ncbi:MULTISPECIES: GFA family protein [unclassified Rhizobium]|uniref:GFA family protein n=1 Tax=unclassified Rhizobium TaxID=2613769 RepID=UPI0007EB5753|nr:MULTISPECIES: GFA family protein [unclassified Rhizobium]ANK83999.1 GFA family glutathione-dependent formaldehyde-activating protein [Rhizobium sp. N731]ANL14247.1 GFA family glutathione-dependent formaldehyde-activating protein [Rhizobium sp. N1314]